MTEKEMLTSFASCTEEDKEVDFTYEEQPFEDTEEGKGNSTHGDQDVWCCRYSVHEKAN